MTESTALGATYLAGIGAGLYGSLDGVSGMWAAERMFEPSMAPDLRDSLYTGWLNAVERVRV